MSMMTQDNQFKEAAAQLRYMLEAAETMYLSERRLGRASNGSLSLRVSLCSVEESVSSQLAYLSICLSAYWLHYLCSQDCLPQSSVKLRTLMIIANAHALWNFYASDALNIGVELPVCTDSFVYHGASL